MQDLKFAPLITMIRVFETELLTEADYKSLLKAETATEALRMLDKTAYEIPQDIDATKDYEFFLDRRLKKIMSEMSATITDARVYRLFTLRYVYHNLKVLIKGRALDHDTSDALIEIGDISVAQLVHLLDTREGPSLPGILVTNTLNILEHIEETEEYATIDVLLDNAYLTHIDKIAHDINNEDVRNYVHMLIDFHNIETLLRALRQGQSKSFVRAMLSRHGRLSIEELLDFYDTPEASTLETILFNEKYGEALMEALGDTAFVALDPVVFSQAMTEVQSKFYYEFSLHAFGPMPVLAYIYFLTNEINNIRMILIGKENELPEEMLVERMRPIYGL